MPPDFQFFLGTHRPSWLRRPEFAGVPLFLSRRVMPRKRFVPAVTKWVLDSGGYTELNRGSWSVTPEQYLAEVRLYRDEIGGLEWAAPMDWMCEPGVREKTGLSVREHQRRTVDNFLRLESGEPGMFVPVLQGWGLDDYLQHIEDYEDAGVPILQAPLVGVGSVCRRNADTEILSILRPLVGLGLRVHAFGVRGEVLRALHYDLASSDSMAWSFDASFNKPPLPGCSHKTCANCSKYALLWRSRLLDTLNQTRMEVLCDI